MPDKTLAPPSLKSHHPFQKCLPKLRQSAVQIETSVAVNGTPVNTRINNVQLVMIDRETYQLAFLD